MYWSWFEKIRQKCLFDSILFPSKKPKIWHFERLAFLQYQQILINHFINFKYKTIFFFSMTKWFYFLSHLITLNLISYKHSPYIFNILVHLLKKQFQYFKRKKENIIIVPTSFFFNFLNSIEIIDVTLIIWVLIAN